MYSLDFTKGAQPLYFQIKQIFKEKMESGQYKIGEVLPSERELQKIFKVSRITVRQALNELVSEGYLSRKRGKGTFVIPHKIEEELSVIKSFPKKCLNVFTPITFPLKLIKCLQVKRWQMLLRLRKGIQSLI